MHEAYAGLEPAELWRHFDALNKIGRPSGHEAAARDYVVRVADAAGCKTRVDDYGNIVVYVPSRVDSATPVCVQAHLDMVKATAPGVEHDFENDPIVPRRDGDRITATGTTLGADNGIGAAAALALITDSSLQTGPLELLFTVEEETGLKGAAALDGSILSSKYLVNLDSEDHDRLTIGCAGGKSTTITLPVEFEPVPADWITEEVRVFGLRGGHSGVEIHKHLMNAIQVQASSLMGRWSRNEEYRLVSINGGSAHNAVPKECTITICRPPDSIGWTGTDTEEMQAAKLEEVRRSSNEPDLNVTFKTLPAARRALTAKDTERLAHLLSSIHTGVIKMSPVFDGKVQTSANLAVVNTHDDSIEILVSIRSFVAGDVDTIEADLRSMADNVGGRLEASPAYPAWEPNPNSKLLRLTMEAFEHILGKPPIVEVIHAGLECGIISAKLPGMEAISFGPNITGAHTPEEAVYPDSVAIIWKLLVEVLRRLR